MFCTAIKPASALFVTAIFTIFLAGCGGGGGSSNGDAVPGNTQGSATAGSVALANCGPGSRPETGLQGQVPLADRQNGRNLEGYSCNLELVGQYQGEGASWINPSFDECIYMGTAFGGTLLKSSQGTQVIDVSDPANLVFSTNLTSPALQIGAWESLDVNEERGLLAGAAVGPVVAAGFFDIYDISADCANPVLQNSFSGNLTLPANFTGHEGAFAPDGNTYYATGFVGGALTAIDVSDPTSPQIIFVGSTVLTNHGFSLNDDGTRLYMSTALPAGLIIFDVSEIQNREAVPAIRQLGSVTWNVAGIAQHSIPVEFDGQPYLIAIDEFASESFKFIDISDEANPFVASEFRLEINQPENIDQRRQDTGGNGLFGYESHYCTVNRKVDPTAMACGHFQSGVRVFDISNPFSPREIAYYNPPAQVGKKLQLQGSEHAATFSGATGAFPVSDLGSGNVASPYLFDPAFSPVADLSADWCSSPPRFVGDNQLWVTCQDNGAMVLEFTNDVYPIQP